MTSHASDPAADRAAILAHVHSIFDAFVRGDIDALRATHSTDWCGFTIKSSRIARGIDGYMAAAIATVEAVETLEYELLETEIQIHGDVALLWYVARDVIRPRGGEPTTLFLRALDVYRRTTEGWTQCGSNICLLPSSAEWTGQLTSASTRPPGHLPPP